MDSKLQLKIEDIAYIAGIIDGEGHIGLHKYRNTYLAKFQIVNTHLETLEWIQQTTEMGNISKSNITNKQCYCLNFKAEEIRRLLPILYRYLRIKKDQAYWLMEHFKTLNGYGPHNPIPDDVKMSREIIYEELQILNK